MAIDCFSEYFAEWENVRARVVRPDVQCTDGVIHVLDTVLVQRSEISVSGQPGRHSSVTSLLPLITGVIMAVLWNNVRL